MKISTKGRYGLRCMIDLALNSSGDQVSIKSIAERQNISENYLEQVFSVLRKSDLVKSIKGSQGGYILSTPTYEIKVGDIIRALEGKIEIVENVHDQIVNNNQIEMILEKCVWARIDDEINAAIDSLNLDDLVDEYRKINEEKVIMYYI